MFSIKQSFANCSICDLLDAPSCILETNCEDDLTKVDVIFIAENPGTKEVEKGLPLVGKAGQLFRTYFKKFNLDKLNYLLTNTVLCQTLNEDGTTGNPDEKTIELCKENCFKLIEICQPKLIVLMGASPMNAFGLAKSGITKLRGQIFQWRKEKTDFLDYDVFLTVHPSFVNRNRSFESKFEDDMKKIGELMGIQFQNDQEKGGSKITGTGIHYYKIPDKYYTSDYRLVDVQYLHNAKQIIYIFRDKDNNKIIHKENDDYYCYQTPEGVEARHLVPYDKLNIIKVPYAQKVMLDGDITYEGDLKLTTKHAQDYYLLKTEEEPSDDELNIMFLDIETYVPQSREFPNPEDAKYPICMITYTYHGKTVTYVIDNKILLKGKNVEEIKTERENNNETVFVYKTEREMLKAFIKDFRQIDCDFLVGWNVLGFDLAYIYNRCPKLQIDPSTLSKFGEVSIDGKRGYADIPGCIILDQLILYQSFTFTRKENYRLGTIGFIELGMDKLDSGGNFTEMFENTPNKAIDYNIRDVEILVELERKLKHIQLENDIRKISKNSFKGSASNMGKLDGLMVSFMKSKGIASRNGNPHTEKDTKFEGAFVKAPIEGVHDWIVDFDFTSLYPSLILTYNIGINSFVMKFKEPDMGYDFVYNFDQFPNEVTMIIDPEYEEKEVLVKKEDLKKKVDEEKLITNISGCFFKQHNKELSIYSEVLEYLLSSRKEYKKKMFNAKQEGNERLKSLYNNRQMVFKILANALYGVLGNQVFRYFNLDLARSITLSGQEAIKTAILEGNAIVQKLKTHKYQEPEKMSKQEIYGDVTRETPYVITGDTDSLFAHLGTLIDKKKSNEEIIKEINDLCSIIQGYLNDEIINKISLRHNVDPAKNRLELKNELIISRGLFLTKKRYAINVVSVEGRSTDETIYMGIDVKRSDYPQFTKECIKELLDIILKTNDKVKLSVLQKFIQRKEQEILEKIKQGDKSIARPIAFSKALKSYKRVPYNVIAMLNWNKLMYDTFHTGDKGYLFKLSGIDMDNAPPDVVEKFQKEFLSKNQKLEYVALPDEETKLPDFFVQDTKAMLKFAWTDRYEQILNPIMKVKEEILTI